MKSDNLKCGNMDREKMAKRNLTRSNNFQFFRDLNLRLSVHLSSATFPQNLSFLPIFLHRVAASVIKYTGEVGLCLKAYIHLFGQF